MMPNVAICVYYSRYDRGKGENPSTRPIYRETLPTWRKVTIRAQNS